MSEHVHKLTLTGFNPIVSAGNATLYLTAKCKFCDHPFRSSVTVKTFDIPSIGRVLADRDFMTAANYYLKREELTEAFAVTLGLLPAPAPFDFLGYLKSLGFTITDVHLAWDCSFGNVRIFISKLKDRRTFCAGINGDMTSPIQLDQPLPNNDIEAAAIVDSLARRNLETVASETVLPLLRSLTDLSADTRRRVEAGFDRFFGFDIDFFLCSRGFTRIQEAGPADWSDVYTRGPQRISVTLKANVPSLPADYCHAGLIGQERYFITYDPLPSSTIEGDRLLNRLASHQNLAETIARIKIITTPPPCQPFAKRCPGHIVANELSVSSFTNARKCDTCGAVFDAMTDMPIGGRCTRKAQ